MRQPSRIRAGLAILLPALAMLLASTGRGAAQEEIGTAPGRGETVSNRSRPEVDPAGVRLGGFRLDAAASLGIGYDDNLLGTNAARVGDGFFETGLRAGLSSDWTSHRLGVQAGLTDRRYFSEGNFDWTDWDVGAFGRYDLDADTPVSASYAHRRLHLDPQSVDLQQAGIVRPVPYDVDEFNIGVSTRINRVRLGVGATYGMYRYENVDSVSGGNVSVFDYDSLTLRFDTGYEFVSGRSVTLGLRWQDVDYRNAAQSDRDSQTVAALVGFRYDFDGVWQGSVAVGYARREYSGSQFKPLETPAVEANVTWNATSLTTLNLTATRTIQESLRTNTASYVTNYAQLRVDHELYRNIILSAAIGLEGQEYQQPTQRALDLIVRPSVRWLVNRNIAMTLDYQYVNRLSRSGGIRDFDENVVFLRVRFAI